MSLSPRQRFLSYVRDPHGSAPVISPFLPHQGVVAATLRSLGGDPAGELVEDEIQLSQRLDYEPMFMTECTGLIFPWQIDEARSTSAEVTRVIATRTGEWTWHASRAEIPWSDAASCPVQRAEDHLWLARVCEEVEGRAQSIRDYFRAWRRKVGEHGVIVLGHPHPSWLGYQITPSSIFYQWADDPELYTRSMEAVAEAALFVMAIAMEEGIDFMSDSSYGLEMTSPELFAAMDLPYIQRFSRWTHERGGLFWYHNCGFTRRLIMDGIFDTLGADVIETIAPPPEGDNMLAESRRALDRGICSKGNLSLGLLRDGRPEQVCHQAQSMVQAVKGYPHIFSTADAVLPGTPPESFVAMIEGLHQALGR